MEDILCNNYRVKRFVNTPVPSNTFLMVDEERKECVVIDPGSKNQNDVQEYIRTGGYILRFIILTHEHFDHCWGVNSLLSEYPSKVVTTRLCAEWVQTPMNYFNKLYYNSVEMFSINQVDIIAEDVGWSLQWNDVDIKLIDAKGHTDKGMCIDICGWLFSGDTMIYNTKPFLKKKYGASIEDLRETIGRIYSAYNEDTLVLPGHGEVFRLGKMKEFYGEYFETNHYKR